MKVFSFIILIVGFMNICSSSASLGAEFQKDTFIKGILSFPYFSLGSYYGGVDSIIIRMDKQLDILERTDTTLLTPNDIETLNIFGRLRKTNLIYRPFFHLQTDSFEYIVYIDSVSYKNISILNEKELEQDNVFVEIELFGELINLGNLDVIKCNKLLGVRKIKRTK